MNRRSPFQRCGRFAGLFALVVTPLTAHDVITTRLTYTRDISRIFVRRCVQCHGGRIVDPSYLLLRESALGY
jgi:hypothetical protein